MRNIQKSDIPALCAGALLLGSGGGGHTQILSDLVKQQFDQYGPSRLITIHELNENHIVVPLAFIGAPLVSMEKIPNIRTFESLLFQIQKDFPNKEIVLMSAEIGGCNGLTPLLISAKYQLPILDADLIGRAFPKMTMCKPAVLGYSPNPTYLADFLGNSITLHVNEIETVEALARSVVMKFGSCAAAALFIFFGEKIKKIADYVIPGSVSHAISLGNSLLNREKISQVDMKIIAEGRIESLFHDIKNGFLNGHVSLQIASKKNIQVYFQNEFLLAMCDEKVLIESPDIICLIDNKNGMPITTDTLKFGLSVSLLKINSPAFWLEEKSHCIVKADKELLLEKHPC